MKVKSLMLITGGMLFVVTSQWGSSSAKSVDNTVAKQAVEAFKSTVDSGGKDKKLTMPVKTNAALPKQTKQNIKKKDEDRSEDKSKKTKKNPNDKGLKVKGEKVLVDDKKNAASITNRLEVLSKTMQNVAAEIKALEISKKTIGGGEVPSLTNNDYNGLHFYVGVGIYYSFVCIKDKITSNKRQLKWNEQKMDYYSLISSVLSFVERDAEGNIIYDENTGYPKYVIRENPMMDPEIQACYENITKYVDGTPSGGTIKASKKAELQRLLKNKVDELIGASESSNYQNSLMMVTYGAGGVADLDTRYFRYSNVNLGKNEYGNTSDCQFYFGEAPTPHDILGYGDGINNLSNLKWSNLIFTDRKGGIDNNGQHVNFAQILGAVVEQTFEGSSAVTEAGQKGMYTGLYSQRYRENSNDAFTKTYDLQEVNDNIKTHKPAFGGYIFGGWGNRSGKIYYGIEVEAGYSNIKANVVSSDKKYVKHADFAGGNIQYLSRDEVLKNPVTGKYYEEGAVYNPETGDVRPIHVSGLGRQAGGTALELPDISRAYSVDVKKSISFAITPMVGYCHANTIYYASLGVTYNKYEVRIKPDADILNQYENAIPVAYMKGYMENLKGSTFLHKYVKKMNDSGEYITVDNVRGEENSISNYKMEPIYPSSVIEENGDGEQNTFSGIRINYPHYKDGGVSVVGEQDSKEQAERPWLDTALKSTILQTQKTKKFRFGFEPGIGFRTYLNSKYFVDIRYSCQFAQKIKVKQDSFAAFPSHIGRSGLNHKIQISGHKIKLSFGRTI